MYGAVIVAAGLASRMGEFKPLMKFGNMTLIERIISTLKKVGVDQIVVVTGNNAKALENELKNSGVIFLRNEQYASTQMLDSANIGFRYLKEKCEKIVFTPSDIPLYRADTVEKLLASLHAIAYPLYQNKRGHPICFQSSIVDTILDYSGNQGLRGALSSILDIEEIPVEDQGILYDADSKEDYEKLLQIHNHQLYRPQLNIGIVKEEVMINDEVAQLLYLIQTMGSIKDACSKMNLSYSKALKLIKKLEMQIKKEIVVRQPGGSQGGYAYLSEDGKKLLSLFREYEKRLNEESNRLFFEKFKEFMQ